MVWDFALQHTDKLGPFELTGPHELMCFDGSAPMGSIDGVPESDMFVRLLVYYFAE